MFTVLIGKVILQKHLCCCLRGAFNRCFYVVGRKYLVKFHNKTGNYDAFVCLINVSVLDWSTMYGIFTKENRF